MILYQIVKLVVMLLPASPVLRVPSNLTKMINFLALKNVIWKDSLLKKIRYVKHVLKIAKNVKEEIPVIHVKKVLFMKK